MTASDLPLCATARACANVALVKYWGKRASDLNLPARGSLSITLDALHTRTTVRFTPDQTDHITIDGIRHEGEVLNRASALLSLVRSSAGLSAGARIESNSSVPFASGLA